MKKTHIVTIAAIVALAGLVAAPSAFAEGRLQVHADYNTPVGSSTIDPNVEFGASYHFWGIFFFNGSIYTDIVAGGDNVLGIQAIRPIGLFSLGGGMRIPLGGFGLLLDWERFYTGAWSNAGVDDFSDAYRIGLDIELSKSFSIEVFSRTFYNFTGASIAGAPIVVPSTGKLSVIGAGAVLHLF